MPELWRNIQNIDIELLHHIKIKYHTYFDKKCAFYRKNAILVFQTYCKYFTLTP